MKTMKKGLEVSLVKNAPVPFLFSVSKVLLGYKCSVANRLSCLFTFCGKRLDVSLLSLWQELKVI